MKKIPGKIRAVLLVMAIASSGVFLAPGAASAYNYDIKDTTTVCYGHNSWGAARTILVERSLNIAVGCEAFQVDGKTFESYIGSCVNNIEKAYLDNACADGNAVIDWNDWYNANDSFKPNNCLKRKGDDLVSVSNTTDGQIDCVANFSF